MVHRQGNGADLMSAPPADMVAPPPIARSTVQYENTVRQAACMMLLQRTLLAAALSVRREHAPNKSLEHRAMQMSWPYTFTLDCAGAALPYQGEGVWAVRAELLRKTHTHAPDPHGARRKGLSRRPR